MSYWLSTGECPVVAGCAARRDASVFKRSRLPRQRRCMTGLACRRRRHVGR